MIKYLKSLFKMKKPASHCFNLEERLAKCKIMNKEFEDILNSNIEYYAYWETNNINKLKNMNQFSTEWTMLNYNGMDLSLLQPGRDVYKLLYGVSGYEIELRYLLSGIHYRYVKSQNQNNMNTKICFKSDGTKETGAKIIAALIKLGGDNPSKKEGRADECYYCIDGNNIITYFTSIPIGYTLVDIYTYKHEEKREQHAEFTVEGSSALLEAFIKECECPLGRNGILSLERFIDPPIEGCLLFTDKDNGIRITSCHNKRDAHFILPNDWNKAMSLAKNFFKPKYFVPKLNTWVWISDKNVYGSNTVDALIYNNGKPKSYGFDHGGDWEDEYHLCNAKPDEFLRQATEDEVRDALIKEAKKRGLVDGAKYVYPWDNGILHRTVGDTYSYDPNWSDSVSVLSSNGYVLWWSDKGWANVIKDIITVAGIEFKYNKMGELECEYGSINSGHLSKLRQAVIETRYCGKRIESIKIGCTDFTIKDISTLSDFFIEQQNK